MTQYYSAYRARTMCPTCSKESDVFITNDGVFPQASQTCTNCLTTFIGDDFLVSLTELNSNISVSAQTSLQIYSC